MTVLRGIRVLDLTTVLAGPFCCHQLAHLGAEVIKIENPRGGDLARQLGADPELNAAGMGVSFLAQNAGKKSVTLNLKHPHGRSIFLKLVATADVVVENFRPGVMDRLGLSWDMLKAANPRLVCCAISGFGQTGPWVARPAYDQIIQGVSGLMTITGAGGDASYRAGFPVGDTVGGLTAAFAIAAALQDRTRPHFIDVSMLEALLATMGWVISNYLVAGQLPAAHGNENPTSAPSGAFATQSGLLNIAANKDEQWEALAAHLGLSRLLDEPDYATREARKANRGALKREIEVVLATKPARVWETELNALGVPAGAVLTVPEVLAEPQVSERGFLGTFDQVPGVNRDVTVARTGIKLDGVAPAVDTPPPRLGQDTLEVLAGLGLTDDEVAALQREGAI